MSLIFLGWKCHYIINLMIINSVFALRWNGVQIALWLKRCDLNLEIVHQLALKLESSIKDIGHKQYLTQWGSQICSKKISKIYFVLCCLIQTFWVDGIVIRKKSEIDHLHHLSEQGKRTNKPGVTCNLFVWFLIYVDRRYE